MHQTFLVLRIFFFSLCLFGGWLVSYANADMNVLLVVSVSAGIGILVILVDIYIKGFSLSGFTALTFGLSIGAFFSHLISSSPLFEPLIGTEIEGVAFIARLVLTVVMMYLGAVIALRGRDEFYLVIPYVRFQSKLNDFSITMLDTSVLIDGRIAGICKSGWWTNELVIPSFILQELQGIADSSDPKKRDRGRKGLRVLNELRNMKLEVRIHEVELDDKDSRDEKLIMLASSMRARLLTTDFNLAQMAQFRGVQWLNLNDLSKALHPDIEVGNMFYIDLIKEGKEPTQAIGYLRDGSMVVVNQAHRLIGENVQVEVTSIIPSSAGKMVFADLVESSS
ncbi:MAG: PIN domain-containing protein [Opitutales bacterium]|nr:PIN domain-containing protein [Opitutales bacterium]